jgi:hypothetical protein
MMFQYIRSFAEHFGDLEYGKLLKSTRTVKPFLIERVLIAPYNISYHLEHHLYPAVPSTTCRRCITADGRSRLQRTGAHDQGLFLRAAQGTLNLIPILPDGNRRHAGGMRMPLCKAWESILADMGRANR